MKNKIIALLLVLTLLSGTCAYAVPLDLWEYDSRFESIYTVNRAANDFDMLQKIIDYVGIAHKEDINGEDNVSLKLAIRTCFFRPVFRHYFGKSLANTTVLASFLSHIDKKQLEKNSSNLKFLKFGIFRGGRVRKYFRILNPTTKKKPNLRDFRRVRIANFRLRRR